MGGLKIEGQLYTIHKAPIIEAIADVVYMSENLNG